MNLKFNRKKERVLLLTIFYRFAKAIFFISSKVKLRFYLNMEWIFWRLAIEETTKVYSFFNNPVKLGNIKFLCDLMQSHYDVIDIGCKHGEITKLVGEKVKSVIGLDYDYKAIAIAQENNNSSNVQFKCIDAFDFLKMNIKVYDVCVLSHIIEHLDEPSLFLKEFNPYFKFIYIEVPDFDYSYLNHYRYYQQMPLIYSDKDHIWEFDRVLIEKIINESGFNILKSEYIYGVQKYWCKNNSY